VAVHATQNHRQDQSPEWGTWSAGWSPWCYLREHHPDVQVYEYELPDGIDGWVDEDQAAIWLAPDLGYGEKRAALARQISRLELGPDVPDSAVTEHAAVRLVSLCDLAGALRWSGRDMAAAAEELTVDEETVRVRVGMLPAADRRELDRRTRPRHLTAVPAAPPAPREVRPDCAAIGYTAERGWHMTEAPPSWLLDILAEAD
jgi:hypothetical protein